MNLLYWVLALGIVVGAVYFLVKLFMKKLSAKSFGTVIPEEYKEMAREAANFFKSDDYARLMFETAKNRESYADGMPKTCHFCKQIINEVPKMFSVAMLSSEPKAITKGKDVLEYVKAENQRFAHGNCFEKAMQKNLPPNNSFKRTPPNAGGAA